MFEAATGSLDLHIPFDPKCLKFGCSYGLAFSMWMNGWNPATGAGGRMAEFLRSVRLLLVAPGAFSLQPGKLRNGRDQLE